MDIQSTAPYIKTILRRIPSKLLRESLKANLPDLSLLQWASIGGLVMRPKTQAKLYREMLPFAQTEYERELLDCAVQDIDQLGFVDIKAQTAYIKQNGPDAFPYFPFLERCQLPILLKKGDLAKTRRGSKKYAFLICDTPENLPEWSDLSDESYYCYSLDSGTPEDLFVIHDHIHVCFADACMENDLNDAQKDALKYILQKLEDTNGQTGTADYSL